MSSFSTRIALLLSFISSKLRPGTEGVGGGAAAQEGSGGAGDSSEATVSAAGGGWDTVGWRGGGGVPGCVAGVEEEEDGSWP